MPSSSSRHGCVATCLVHLSAAHLFTSLYLRYSSLHSCRTPTPPEMNMVGSTIVQLQQ